jgi:hypothetical protein
LAYRKLGPNLAHSLHSPVCDLGLTHVLNEVARAPAFPAPGLYYF